MAEATAGSLAHTAAGTASKKNQKKEAKKAARRVAKQKVAAAVASAERAAELDAADGDGGFMMLTNDHNRKAAALPAQLKRLLADASAMRVHARTAVHGLLQHYRMSSCSSSRAAASLLTAAVTRCR